MTLEEKMAILEANVDKLTKKTSVLDPEIEIIKTFTNEFQVSGYKLKTAKDIKIRFLKTITKIIAILNASITIVLGLIV